MYKTIEKLVNEINTASRNEIAAVTQAAMVKSNDFRLSPDERVTWRLMLQLLNSELERY